MIVVDVNVLVYAQIEGDKTPLALKVKETDPQWVVPPLWQHEFLNVLATFTRHGVLDLPQASKIWQQARRRLQRAERKVELAAALTLATEQRISAYDAQYLALARSLGVLCVSEDRALQKKFPALAVSMAAFCS